MPPQTVLYRTWATFGSHRLHRRLFYDARLQPNIAKTVPASFKKLNCSFFNVLIKIHLWSDLLESSSSVGEPRGHLSQGHARHHGQHDLLALGRVRVLDVFEQPRLECGRRLAAQRLGPRRHCRWWRHGITARWRHVETAAAATRSSSSAQG